MLTDKYNEDVDQLCKKCVELAPYRTNDQLFKIFEKGIYKAKMDFLQEAGCIDLDPKRVKEDSKLSESERKAMGKQFDHGRAMRNDIERLRHENAEIVEGHKNQMKVLEKREKEQDKERDRLIKERDKLEQKVVDLREHLEWQKGEIRRRHAIIAKRCRELGIPVPTIAEIQQFAAEDRRKKVETLKKWQNPFRSK